MGVAAAEAATWKGLRVGGPGLAMGAGGIGGGPSGRRRQWVFVLRGRAWCRCPMCLLVGGFT